MPARGTDPVGPELDHVLIAVTDLEAAAREIEARHGLASVEGGRHSGWGTANRIIPLGDAYLELVAVAEEAEAAQSTLGRWVTRTRAADPQPLGWAVRTDSVDSLARRLDLTVAAGSRAMPQGPPLWWRAAGLERAAAEPSLPFFLEWGEGTPYPGRTRADHPAGPVSIAELRLAGDPDRIADWLGPNELPITIRPGEPALESVVLAGSAGRIEISR